jgi:hypothetical protein
MIFKVEKEEIGTVKGRQGLQWRQNHRDVINLTAFKAKANSIPTVKSQCEPLNWKIKKEMKI